MRHLALRSLLGRAADDPDVVAAREVAMRTDPIAGILAAQNPDGWWSKPGHGYSPKYTATVWEIIFLGADGADPRVRTACEYLLTHTQAASGGFSFRGSGTGRPEQSGVAHCLNGNLLRALIGFGWLDDPRVQASVTYQAASITGDGGVVFNRSATTGPGFRCAMNLGEPCAWGATKALLALARVPVDRRTPAVARAIEQGTGFLLSHDPSVADYPMGPDTRPNRSWFELGFPLGYVGDVMQVLEAVCEAGGAADPRLDGAVDWVVAQQKPDGRWANNHSYSGKTVVMIDDSARRSKWVALRACRVLKAVADARAAT